MRDEDLRELEATIDGLSEENGQLAYEKDELVGAIRDALADLRTIDVVPFGRVAEYVEEVVRELRAVITP